MNQRFCHVEKFCFNNLKLSLHINKYNLQKKNIWKGTKCFPQIVHEHCHRLLLQHTKKILIPEQRTCRLNGEVMQFAADKRA